MADCPWSIRPFPNETQIDCGRKDDKHELHEGRLEDYAFPGSVTEISWMAGDRREFGGDWPGYCHRLDSVTGPPDPGGHVCTLPSGHGGRCEP